jgi:hypothetical protein
MKKRLGFAGAFYLAALAAGTFCTTAHADVKYTESVKTDMGAAGGKGAAGMGAMNNTTTTYIADGAQRIESSIQYGPVKMNDITITDCAKKKTFKVDPELKIYTATDITEGGHSAPSRPAAPGAPAQKSSGKKGTGKIIKLKLKMETWVADYKMPVFDCGDKPWQGGGGYGGGGHSDCDISFVQNGDTKAMTDAYRGLIMRMKTYMPGDKGKDMVITREITGLYEAKLPDSTFSIPAGYKLVSDQDFQKERSAAMMKGMMSGMGAAGAGHDDNDGDEAKNNTTDQDDDKGDEDQPEEKPQEKPKKPKFKFKLPF